MVKFSKVEWAGISLTALTLVFLAGWSLQGVAGDSYRVSAQRGLLTDQAAVQSFTPDQPVDLNTATLADLMALPGLGEVRAQAILDYRSANGPFTYPEDIINVSGIGQITYEQLADQITTDGARGGSS